MGRLLLVSNRLPVTVEVEGERVRVHPSAGGLATGLRGPHEASNGLWIGWPGDTSGLPAAQQKELAERLAELRTVPVTLEPEEIKGYYDHFANGVVWPLFHYLPDRIPLHARRWNTYRRVNERFAEAVAKHYQPGDTIWVHDYHLLLVPALLRQKLPDAEIGFFLHIPFPSTETFRVFPWRTEILEGLLGADLIGFHTFAYMRHFASAVSRLLGVDVNVDEVRHRGHQSRLGVFPMGIDAQAFAAVAADPATEAERAAIVSRHQGQQIILGVDRLDYTKGIPRRLVAFERLLQRHPEVRGRVQLIQVAVPSRSTLPEYASTRHQLERLVSRVNGAYGHVDWMPIHYLYQSLNERQLTALYRAADVMLVTPLRDGMNLVAKEFAAARTDEGGVLVLSELAGAGAELGGALAVNPYDVDGMVATMRRALTMSDDERRLRMRALRERVFAYDVHRWVDTFTRELDQAHADGAAARPGFSPPQVVAEVTARLRKAAKLALVLDYDGTLSEFASSPDQAAPDDDLLQLIAALAARPGTRVNIVSGRSHESLERWFGALPIGLHAEHGILSRPAGAKAWVQRRAVPEGWNARIRPILEQFTAATPGSLVEEKIGSIAWHYRNAEAEFGTFQARELMLHLSERLTNLPVEVTMGPKVVEVKLHGARKAAVVPALLEEIGKDALILAMGDDRSDEELFARLPPEAITVDVGGGKGARLAVPDVAAARGLLRAILSQP